MNDRPARRVPCPRCAAPSLFAAANRWRPFCSERCAGIDLGAWASEAYRVASDPPADGAGSEGVDAPTNLSPLPRAEASGLESRIRAPIIALLALIHIEC